MTRSTWTSLLRLLEPFEEGANSTTFNKSTLSRNDAKMVCTGHKVPGIAMTGRTGLPAIALDFRVASGLFILQRFSLYK